MKICNGCNAGNADNAKYCQKCGADISNISPLLNAPTGGYYAPAVDYTRLGGWLVFFIVWDLISVFGGGMSLLTLPLTLIGGEFVFSSIEAALCSVIPAVPLLVSVIFRFKRDSHFLLWFQISVIVSLLASIYLIGVSSYFNDMLEPFAPLYSAMGQDIMDFAGMIKIISLIFGIIGAGLQFFLITLYYCKSKRVNVFMETDEYKQKALIRF